MKRKKRILIATLMGAGLGIICIIGVGKRVGVEGNELFLFSTWLNRVIIGFVIGIAYNFKLMKGKLNVVIRGLFFGVLFSGAFFLSSGMRDIPGLLAGIAYGIAIDYFSTRFTSDILSKQSD